MSWLQQVLLLRWSNLLQFVYLLANSIFSRVLWHNFIWHWSACRVVWTVNASDKGVKPDNRDREVSLPFARNLPKQTQNQLFTDRKPCTNNAQSRKSGPQNSLLIHDQNLKGPLGLTYLFFHVAAF